MSAFHLTGDVSVSEHPRRDLSRLLSPRAIAVVGASSNPSTISGKPTHYLRLHGYSGSVFPINPRRDSISGYKCYGDLSSLPETPDLAIVALAAQGVPTALRDCGQRGVPFAVVLASGFAEAGGEGVRLQQELQEIAKQYGIGVVGPNCNGILNVPDRVYAGFPSVFGIPEFRSGPVSLVSQSGGLGFGLFGLAESRGIGFRHVISVGNGAVLDVLDFLEYFIDDDGTQIILAYLEGLKDGRRFRAIAERALRKEKPIVVMKAATTEAGCKAAAAHTANLATGGALYQTLFDQCGVVEVQDLEDIVDFVRIFRHGRKPAGKRVAVVTTTAGSGVVLADSCARGGLLLPSLNEQTESALRTLLPSFASVINPVDVTANIHSNASLLRAALEAVLRDDGIDSLAIINGSRDGEVGVSTARAIVEVATHTEKPVVVCWFAREELAADGYRVLNETGIPRYETPTKAGNALAMLVNYFERRRRALSTVRPVHRKIVSEPRVRPDGQWITEHRAKRWLGDWGIPMPQEELVSRMEDAVDVAARIGYPVALKLMSGNLPHKSDVGGVCLDLRSADEVRKAYRSISEQIRSRHPKANIEGMLVQEMAPKGIEMIVGGSNDPLFGPVVMVGSGGVLVEVLNDVVFRLAPVSAESAHEMVTETKGNCLLKGFRGTGVADVDALASLIAAVSRFLADNEDTVAEIDLNPVTVLSAGSGIRVLDALIKLRAS